MTQLSKRDDPCRSCGDPLLTCPATIRRFVRCCGGCTHRTPADRHYEAANPDYREYFG